VKRRRPRVNDSSELQQISYPRKNRHQAAELVDVAGETQRPARSSPAQDRLFRGPALFADATGSLTAVTY
jgi:hypothetical protein